MGYKNELIKKEFNQRKILIFLMFIIIILKISIHFFI